MTTNMGSVEEVRARATPWRHSAWLPVGELSFIVALALADIYTAVPMSRTPFLVVLGWVSLRLRTRRWREVGFARPHRWPRALVIGVLAGIVFELFSTFVTLPLWSGLTGRPPDLSDFRPLVGNPGLLVLATAVMWPLAAFGEELAFRGYLMSRIAGLARGTPAAWLVSLVVVSAYFGWGHDAQGITGILQEGLAGVMLGLLYLACRRNLTAPIVAHGVSNTLAFVLIYFDRYPGV